MSDAAFKYPRSRLALVAVVLEVILGLGAIGGGLALMLGPHGEVLPLPVFLLKGSPFQSYFVPGLILLTLIGIGPLVAAVFAWRQQRWAPFLTLAVGIALLGWMTVEIYLIGYSSTPPLQPIYIGLGLAITGVGIAWLWRTGPVVRTLSGDVPSARGPL
ncbi:MAG: hypothetical protein ABIQ16_20475 [Polyangiaceae bacterium]